jgi:WD40 repeat protein
VLNLTGAGSSFCAGAPRPVDQWARWAARTMLILLVLPGCRRSTPAPVFTSPPDPVEALAYAADADLLAAAMHMTVKVWDVRDGKVVLTLTEPEEVGAIALTRDGKRLAMGRSDRTIRMIDVGTGKELVAMGGAKGAADVERGNSQDKGAAPAPAPSDSAAAKGPGHTGPLTGLAFSPDGNTLASTAGNPNPFGLVLEVKLWNAQTGSLLANLDGGHKSAVTCVAFSADGKTLITGGRDSKLVVWDVASRKATKTFPMPIDVAAVALAPNGKTAAAGTFDPEVVLVDSSSWTEKAKLNGHQDRVNAIAFSPDSNSLASASTDRTVKIWDLATGKVQNTLVGHANRVLSVVYSANGKTLFTGGYDGTLRLWDPATGAERSQLQ